MPRRGKSVTIRMEEGVYVRLLALAEKTPSPPGVLSDGRTVVTRRLLEAALTVVEKGDWPFLEALVAAITSNPELTRAPFTLQHGPRPDDE